MRKAQTHQMGKARTLWPELSALTKLQSFGVDLQIPPREAIRPVPGLEE
jgi:hypothetical protein